MSDLSQIGVYEDSVLQFFFIIMQFKKFTLNKFNNNTLSYRMIKIY